MTLQLNRQSIVVLVVVAFSVLAEGCGAPLNGKTFVLPLPPRDGVPPNYIKCIDSAVLDSSHVAIVWVDESRKGDRLWSTVVRLREDGAFEQSTPTSHIDSGSIMDARVFADGASYGIVYAKNLKLVVRRPWTAPPLQPLALKKQSMQAIAAYADSGGVLYIVGLMIGIGSSGSEYFSFALACKDTASDLKVLGQLKMPFLRQQPRPYLYPLGDSLGVAIFQNWGSHTSREAPFDSVGKANGEAGAYVLLRLMMSPSAQLAFVPVASATIPHHSDIAFATSIVPADQRGQHLATTSTGSYILSPFDSESTPQLISSKLGSGANYANDRIQAVGLDNGSSLVMWIDAADEVSLTNIRAGREPSQFGGDIRAAIVTDGIASSAALDNFPIQTQAQCITSQRLGHKIVLVYARASDSWTGDARRPDGICVTQVSSKRASN